MKTAIITNAGSIYGKKVLNDLLSVGITFDAIVVVKQPLLYYWKLFGYVRKAVGVINAALYSLEHLLSLATAREPATWKGRPFVGDYDRICPQVFYTNGTNTERTEMLLKKIGPDILILGQVGIVGKRILAIPSKGTLNSHPGILPKYRGIDVHLWAIHNDDYGNLGASVHWVDEGIDTGKIIRKDPYSVVKSDTLGTIFNNIENLSVSILTETMASLVKGDLPDGVPQAPEDGKQYHKMSRRLRAITRKKLRAYIQMLGTSAIIG